VLVCSQRRVLLAGCGWLLVRFERKVLLASFARSLHGCVKNVTKLPIHFVVIIAKMPLPPTVLIPYQRSCGGWPPDGGEHGAELDVDDERRPKTPGASTRGASRRPPHLVPAVPPSSLSTSVVSRRKLQIWDFKHYASQLCHS
jgi:hypothetical protein